MIIRRKRKYSVAPFLFDGNSMIYQVRGIVISKSPSEVIVDCNGIGYGISISLATFNQLPELEQSVRLHTVLIPREDSMQLYGFAMPDEKETFLLLTSISGVGPKIALGILSSMSVNELQNAILTNDLVSLQKLHGIGKKSAERILVELRDKIGKVSPSTEAEKEFELHGSVKAIQQDAVSALIALGYQKLAAEKTVKSVLQSHAGEVPSADIVIRKSLQLLQQK